MADKKAKASVGYARGGDHCGVCRHFIEADEDEKTGNAGLEPGTCELVAGTISEDMWCRLFARQPRTLAHEGYKRG